MSWPLTYKRTSTGWEVLPPHARYPITFVSLAELSRWAKDNDVELLREEEG